MNRVKSCLLLFKTLIAVYSVYLRPIFRGKDSLLKKLAYAIVTFFYLLGIWFVLCVLILLGRGEIG